jgi:hypothetical protein
MMNRRSFGQLLLAISVTEWLRPSFASAETSGHRPLVLLLGDTCYRDAFAEGASAVLGTGATSATENLITPQNDIEALTQNLRKWHGGRLTFMGDDRDSLLVHMAIGRADARLLSSGHHRQSDEAASLHNFIPASPRWSCATGLGADLVAVGCRFVIRDSQIPGEQRVEGTGAANSPWSNILGRHLAGWASGLTVSLPLSRSPLANDFQPQAAVATLIADL